MCIRDSPNPIYYQIAQNQYGVAGGSFLGSACNSSGAGGPGSGCVFNDITQGDINLACEDNGTLEEAHCYKPTGTHGVDSTDNVTAATVINGGTGYTTAPTCAIAGPTNNSPYLTPIGGTLWTGGTQAACSAVVNSSSTTAVWSILIETAAAGQTLTFTSNSGAVLATYTLTGTSSVTIATNLAASINTSSFATATESTSGSGSRAKGTVTVTATTAGYAGNFYVSWGGGFLEGPDYVYITNTTPGQGPNYVSGITITTAGSGYQPAYGAAPGYDLATGLGSVNAYNLVESGAWTSEMCIRDRHPYDCDKSRQQNFL